MELAYLIVKFVLAVFAVYRVARMIALEEGMLGVFAAIREKIDPYQKTWVGRGLNCPLCVGFYMSAIAAIVIAPSWLWALGLWLPIAGAQVYLQETEGKL